MRIYASEAGIFLQRLILCTNLRKPRFVVSHHDGMETNLVSFISYALGRQCTRGGVVSPFAILPAHSEWLRTRLVWKRVRRHCSEELKDLVEKSLPEIFDAEFDESGFDIEFECKRKALGLVCLSQINMTRNWVSKMTTILFYFQSLKKACKLIRTNFWRWNIWSWVLDKSDETSTSICKFQLEQYWASWYCSTYRDVLSWSRETWYLALVTSLPRLRTSPSHNIDVDMHMSQLRYLRRQLISSMIEPPLSPHNCAVQWLDRDSE